MSRTQDARKERKRKKRCDSHGQTFHPVCTDAWRRRAGMRRQRGSYCYHPSRVVCMISASLNCSFKLSSRLFDSRCLALSPVVSSLFPPSLRSRDVVSATLIGRRNRTCIHAYIARSFSRLSPNNDPPSREASLPWSLCRASIFSEFPELSCLSREEKRTTDRQFP